MENIEKEIKGFNQINIIFPYRHNNTWVFDDKNVGLKREPFVSGMPEIIDKLAARLNITRADKKFKVIFSKQEFPGYNVRFMRLREQYGGWWYKLVWFDGQNLYEEGVSGAMEGWLCPALFKYFKDAPSQIFIKAEALYNE